MIRRSAYCKAADEAKLGVEQRPTSFAPVTKQLRVFGGEHFVTDHVQNLVASALLGAATGYLSQVGAASVLAITSSHHLPKVVRSPWLRRAVVASAVGEMFANAFVPALSSRSSPGPFIGRIVFGAASGMLVASSRGRSVEIAGLIGGATAGIVAKNSPNLRVTLSERWPDVGVGLTEDVLAIGLAVAANRT